MFILRRIIPFVSPLVLAALYSGLLLRTTEWKGWVMGIILCVVLTIAAMVEFRWKQRHFWSLLFPVALAVYGGTGMLFFVQSMWVKVLLMSIVVVLWGVYLENIFFYLYQPKKYGRLSLPHLSFFLLVFGAFTLGSTLFGLKLINVLPFWAVTVAFMCYAAGLMIHVLRSFHIWKAEHAVIVAIVTLMVGELVWILQYWPTGFYVNGIIVALVLYCIPALIQLQLRDALTRAALLRYVGISAVGLLTILLTTQWS